MQYDCCVCCSVEPDIFLVARGNSSSKGTFNESVIGHVYGSPLEDILPCFRVKGHKSQVRDCTAKDFPSVTTGERSVVRLGSLGEVTVYFSWTPGHKGRGNPFGKAVWTFSHPTERHAVSPLIPDATFILRIYSRFRDDTRKFSMGISDILTAEELDERIPGE